MKIFKQAIEREPTLELVAYYATTSRHGLHSFRTTTFVEALQGAEEIISSGTTRQRFQRNNWVMRLFHQFSLEIR
jgi:hypothetical protein